MDEQNITNIIEYLDQNPDRTTESLVIDLLNEGYIVEDIKAALDRLGISPVVIPGYKETIVYSNPRKSSGGKMIAIALMLLLVVIIIAAIFFMINYFSNAALNSTNTPSGTAATINPATSLKAALSESDYKITINNNIFYLDNGVLARKEVNDGKIYLNWSGIVTILDINSKTYKTYFSQAPEAVSFLNTKDIGIIPLEIIRDTETNKVTWKKINDTTWESTNLPKQQIMYDPSTRLVTKRKLINPDGSVFKEDTITYEKITISQNLIGIPAGYTEQK